MKISVKNQQTTSLDLEKELTEAQEELSAAVIKLDIKASRTKVNAVEKIADKIYKFSVKKAKSQEVTNIVVVQLT